MEHYLEKELYELLKTDRNIFDFIQEGSLDGLWYWDLEKPENEWMNARFWEILGYNPKEMPHTVSAWQDIIHPKDLELALANFNKHIANPQHAYDQEVRYTHKNGTTVWVRCRGLAIRDENGTPKRMLGAHQDITELKNAEEQYRKLAKETVNNLTNLQAVSNISTLFLDKDLNILSFTPSSHSAKHIKNNSFQEIASQFKIKDLKSLCLKVLNTATPIEKEVECEHGNSWWMRISPYIAKDDLNEGLIITLMDITEKKQQDQLIKLLTNVVDNAMDGYAIVNEEGKFVFVNNTYLQMWGYDSVDEVLGTSPHSHSLNPTDPAAFMKQIHAEGKGEFESIALRKDGTTFHVGLNAYKYIDNSGKIFFPTFFKDISEKKQQEKELYNHRNNLQKLVAEKSQELRKSEKRFRILFDDSPTGIYETDAHGKCLMVNKRWQEMAGMTEEEALGDNWINGIYEEDRQLVFDNWNKYALTKKSWSAEYRFCNKAGKVTWVYGTAKPLLDDNNNITGYIGTNTDITEQKKAQTEVQKQRDLFETVINSVPTRIFWKDKNGVYLGCNPNFAHDAGVKEVKNVIGCKDEDFVWGKDAELYREADREVMKSGKSKQNYEEPFIGIDGNQIIWRTNKMPLKDSQGKTIGIIATAENITQEKKIADEIATSQKRYQSLFDNSPIPLWEEDFSEVKQFVEELKASGVEDFQKYFNENTDKVEACSKLIRIIDVNYAAVKLHQAKTKEELFNGLGQIFTPDSYKAFLLELLAIANNETECAFEGKVKTLQGKEIDVQLKWQVVPAYEKTLEKVYLSTSNISALKQAENELKDSEAKFRGAFEDTNVGIALGSGTGDVIEVNEEYLKITGYTYDEFININYTEITHPDDISKEVALFDKVLKGEIDSYRIEKRLRSKNGNYIWLDCAVSCRRNEQKQVDLTIALVIDISERIQAENIIKSQNEEYEALNEELKQTNQQLSWAIDREQASMELLDKAMKATRDGIWDWHIQNDTVLFSDRWFDIIGITDKKNSFSNWEKRIHSDDKKRIMASLNEHLEGKSEQWHEEHRLLTGQGTYKWVLGRGKIVEKDPNGLPLRMVGTMVDIEEIKRAEEKIRESEEKLRLAIDNSPLGVSMSDIKGRFVSCNNSFEEIVGYTAQELKTLSYKDITHPDYIEKNKVVFEQLVNNETTNYTLEKIYIKKDGKHVHAIVHAGLIRNTSGEPEFVLAFTEDISLNKKSEQELRVAKEKAEESNRLKTEFLHNMSHEIRTPMNGIMGFSNLIGDSELNHEQRSYYATIIQNSSQQLMRIIDDILEISTLETKQIKANKKRFNLNDFITHLFSIFDIKAKERQIPFYIKKALNDEESFITSDKSKLNKILSNLLENALKFTTQGYIELGYYIKETNIVLYVKDTGSGIDTNNQQRIFERFSQEDKHIASSHGGLGLGLSISKENTELLGGKISVKSAKGKGATFLVTFPFSVLSYVPLGKKKNGSNKVAPQCTILIAEDEEINFLYLETLLRTFEHKNITLLHAINGAEAVEECAITQKIDLVLMDIKMPKMNGYEATRKIRESNSEVPIIAQTAYSTEADKQHALEAGCNYFISKPINKEELFELLNQYISFT